MSKEKLTAQRGFALIELIVATVIVVIVISGIGIILADSQSGWKTMYDLAYADVVTDSYVARKMFDAVIRNASGERLLLDEGGGQLSVEHGTLDPDGVKTALTTQIVCKNVSGCVFKRAGRSAQMILTLDDGSKTATVVSSAVMHNR
ncbi:MAG: hypothetical protein AMJ43_00605 [Coxiella sp. DG_40]|nr:MAG: hypothetical protein AMJ43_00605 [Coxiella sp. DG_40]